MFYYPTKATTIKTINKFNYSLYYDISINMLKYNNDSNNIINILSAAIDTNNDIKEDLVYKPRFNIKDLDFITIDRFNGFVLDKIPNISIVKDDNNIHCKNIVGFSKYTNREYTLKKIDTNTDFTRHSFPCDCFMGEEVIVDGSTLITLYPNISNKVNIETSNTQITILPYSGLDKRYLIDEAITLFISGITITNTLVEEEIIISSYKEIKSKNIYKEIRSIRMIGSTISIKVIVMPYINGEAVEWDQEIIDRETLSRYETLLTVDSAEKELSLNILNDIKTEFPINIEKYRNIKLDIQGTSIINHYIDKSNKLIYAVDDSDILYCFPMIIPKSDNSTFLKQKTKYQSIRIEYYDDSINKEYTFYIFPVNKTNDVEIMSIYINGEEYDSDILLDLYRENIESNRFIIPYSTLFDVNDESKIEFITYGLDESITPIFLSNKKLEPLYTLDLKTISIFSSPSSGYGAPDMTSRNVEYKEYISGDISNQDYKLLKLSSRGNIIINGYELINVYDTFYYDSESNMIITSDTITHVKGIQ